MTNERKKELLRLIAKTIWDKLTSNEGHYYHRGICSYITHATIASADEIVELHTWFISKQPGFFSRFFWNKYFDPESIRNPYAYWWELSREGDKQRVKFLEHLIRKLK